MRNSIAIMMLIVSMLALSGCESSPRSQTEDPIQQQDTKNQTLKPDRLVKLEGSNNFRDLGGYKTKDGRTVKWGEIYRSDSLGELTPSDLDKLAERNIKTVIDFRSDKEREKEPDLVPKTVEKEIHFQVGATAVDPDEFRQNLFSGNLKGADFRQMLIDGNKQMIQQGEEPYGGLIKTLAKPEASPLVYHCAGGKDRTGVGTALLLSILGVPRETIIEDYLLTNEYRKEYNAKTREKMRKVLPDLADEIHDARQANRDYIVAAFNEIDQYGGLDKYVREVLKIDDETVEALKNRYLE